MIRAQNIQLQIGKKRILDEVSTELHAGQLLAICGPNGAGKSSLLRILSGEMKATKGNVWIKNKNLHDWDAQDLAKMPSRTSKTRKTALRTLKMRPRPFKKL